MKIIRNEFSNQSFIMVKRGMEVAIFEPKLKQIMSTAMII
jgi:hypothetical protein